MCMYFLFYLTQTQVKDIYESACGWFVPESLWSDLLQQFVIDYNETSYSLSELSDSGSILDILFSCGSVQSVQLYAHGHTVIHWAVMVVCVVLVIFSDSSSNELELAAFNNV